MVVYYDDIDVLPVFNWDKYLKTHINNWFIKGFDGRQPVVKDEMLEVIEKKIEDQYFIELDDRSVFARFQKMAKIDNLITKYNLLMILLNRCYKGFTEDQQATKKEYYAKLAKEGFRIKDETEAELLEFMQMAEGIKTQIKIIESEVKEVTKGKPRGLMYQLKIIEKTLGFTVALNPKKLTVKEFIELCKEMENGDR